MKKLNNSTESAFFMDVELVNKEENVQDDDNLFSTLNKLEIEMVDHVKELGIFVKRAQNRGNK